MAQVGDERLEAAQREQYAPSFESSCLMNRRILSSIVSALVASAFMEASPTLYTLTRRAVAYMIAMPAVRPPRFAPERAGALERAESLRRSRVTS